ncbi:MAG: type II secretion system GspH family protein [Phycisphaerales bacterium]|nr:type II secretion system GspH family protein [Phycisphaerales bacterium]
MTRRGLTLVEIVVVTSILGVLLALAASGVSQVMATGRGTTCRANLRQLHLAAETYRGIESSYPAAVLYYADGGSLRTAAWDFDHRGGGHIEPGPIWSYLGDPRVFQCPDFRGGSTFGDDPSTGYNYNTSYVGAEGRFPTIDEHGKLLEGWRHCRQGIPAAAHRRSSSTALFGDGGWKMGANKFMRAPSNAVEADLGLVCAGGQAYRHLNCTNIVCLDGHCECLESSFEGPHATDEILRDVMDYPKNGFLSEDDTRYDPR